MAMEAKFFLVDTHNDAETSSDAASTISNVPVRWPWKPSFFWLIPTITQKRQVMQQVLYPMFLSNCHRLTTRESPIILGTVFWKYLFILDFVIKIMKRHFKCRWSDGYWTPTRVPRSTVMVNGLYACSCDWCHTCRPTETSNFGSRYQYGTMFIIFYFLAFGSSWFIQCTYTITITYRI